MSELLFGQSVLPKPAQFCTQLNVGLSLLGRQLDRRQILSRCVFMPTERRQHPSGFLAQSRIGGIQFNRIGKIGDSQIKPAAADAETRQRGQIVRLINAIGQSGAIASFRVVGAPHLFVKLTKRQPARAIFRFQSEGVFQFSDGLLAAAKFFQAQCEVLPGPNGLRIEREGAQVLVEPIGTWIMYMIHQVIQKYKDLKGLEEGAVLPPVWRLDKRAKIEWTFRNKVAKLKLAEAIFKREYHRVGNALGGIAHHLVDQYELQRMGHPFYNSRAGGGEGHLEVAKNIYYSNKDLCHMVLSVKPFGCMPSTQSDGAQAAVISRFKDIIFLPIETSGEGEINAHSRVQMALAEAKAAARREFDEALARTGRSLDDIRAWVARRPELRHALYRVPRQRGIAGTAANFVLHVSDLMRGGRHTRSTQVATPEARQGA